MGILRRVMKDEQLIVGIVGISIIVCVTIGVVALVAWMEYIDFHPSEMLVALLRTIFGG